MAFKNYYILLGIKNTASLEEIKLAFRNLAKKYHPDKNQDDDSTANAFKEIQEAYEILSNAEKRKKYDLKFSYSTNYQQIKNKRHAPYTGNAYQYAQQQAEYQQRYAKQEPQASKETSIKEKKSATDPYLFVISIVVAILLLLFIMFLGK